LRFGGFFTEVARVPRLFAPTGELLTAHGTAHYQILGIRGSACGKNETPAAMMMEGLRKSRRLFRFLRFKMAAYSLATGKQLVDELRVECGCLLFWLNGHSSDSFLKLGCLLHFVRLHKLSDTLFSFGKRRVTDAPLQCHCHDHSVGDGR